MRALRARALIALVPLAAWAPAQESMPTEPGGVTALSMVFAEERPQGHDVLILRGDGGLGEERLVGDLLTDTFPLQAPYLQVELPRARVAGLVMGDPSDPENAYDTLVSVTGDQLSGILTVPSLRFQIHGGEEIDVRRELVARVNLGRHRDSLNGITRRQSVTLHSGDHFTGRVRLDHPLSVSTAYADLEFPMVDLHSVEREEVSGPASVRALDGSVIVGTLEPRRLEVELDITCGLETEPVTVSLYAGRIRELLCQDGTGEMGAALVGVVGDALAIPDASQIFPGSGTSSHSIDRSEIHAFWFVAEEGVEYVIETTNVNSADTVIELLGADGEERLRRDDDGGVGTGSRIQWTASAGGIHYIRVWLYGGGPQFQQGAYYGGNLARGTYEIAITQGGG